MIGFKGVLTGVGLYYGYYGGAGLVVEFHWLWTNPLVLFIGVVDFGLVPTSV